MTYPPLILASQSPRRKLLLRQIGLKFSVQPSAVREDVLDHEAPEENAKRIALSKALEVSKQLYPLARTFEIWTTPQGYLGYPFGWSPVQIYYNPQYVSPAPNSWDVLLDPKYVKRVVPP